MNPRSEVLAVRLEAGAAALLHLPKLSLKPSGRPDFPRMDESWVVVHHVASMYPLEIQLAKLVAPVSPITDVTWEAVAAINRDHEEANDGRQAKPLALLARKQCRCGRALRGFSDEELDRAAPVSLNSNAPLTANSSLKIMQSGTVTITSPGSGPRLPVSNAQSRANRFHIAYAPAQTRLTYFALRSIGAGVMIGRKFTNEKETQTAAVLAHPDDESLGFAATLAGTPWKVSRLLVTATRGEAGRFGSLGSPAIRFEVAAFGRRNFALPPTCSTSAKFNPWLPGWCVDQVPSTLAIRYVRTSGAFSPMCLSLRSRWRLRHPTTCCSHSRPPPPCAAMPIHYDDDRNRIHLILTALRNFNYCAWRKNKWEAYQAAFRKLILRSTVLSGRLPLA